jgi:hypothetical protein
VVIASGYKQFYVILTPAPGPNSNLAAHYILTLDVEVTGGKVHEHKVMLG